MAQKLIATASVHSGPLPPPDDLARYEQVSPGLAKEIVEMAKTQAAHRQGIENRVIDSDIGRARWGQRFAFIIAIVGLGAAVACAFAHEPWPSGFIGTTTIGGLVTAFLRGVKSRRDEREQKQRPPGQ